MPPATAKPHDYDNVDMAYPSRTIAFQAAGMITSIMENLLAHDQVKYQPAFMSVSPHCGIFHMTYSFTVSTVCSQH